MTTPFARAAEAVDLLTALHMTGAIERPLGKAHAADRRQSRGWDWRANIVGLAVARKVAGGDRGGSLGLTVFVRRKLARSRLEKRQIIPGELNLRALAATVTTDVVELRGRLIAQAGAARVRPLCPGIEVSHQYGDAGTLCAVVGWKERPGVPFGLGCSHTLARCGICAKPGVDTIEQPQTARDSAADSVGVLTSRYSEIHFGRPENTADMALFQINDDTGTPSNRIQGENRPRIETIHAGSAEALSHGVETELFGARSCGVVGETQAYHGSWWVEYRKPLGDLAIATFTKVVAYSTPCVEGDSGAPVLEKGTHNLLGMHFAGGPSRADLARDQTVPLGLFFPAAPLFEENGLTLWQTS